MHNNVAPITKALYCHLHFIMVIYVHINIKAPCVEIYRACVIGATVYSEICIIYHPYLAFRIFYLLHSRAATNALIIQNNDRVFTLETGHMLSSQALVYFQFKLFKENTLCTFSQQNVHTSKSKEKHSVVIL